MNDILMKKLIVTAILLACTQIMSFAQAPLNLPGKRTSVKLLAEGPSVWGVFQGRIRCGEISKDPAMMIPPGCEKLKWSFTFYQDPNTHLPATYSIEGSLYREKKREGKWSIIKGTKENPDAVVIQLDPDKPEQSLFFLKGDENVLFMLDHDLTLRVGDSYLSYTFNRVVN